MEDMRQTNDHQLLSKIDTCLSYIYACRVRLDIDKLRHELGFISQAEMKDCFAQTLGHVTIEVVQVNAYLDEVGERELSKALLNHLEESLMLVTSLSRTQETGDIFTESG